MVDVCVKVPPVRENPGGNGLVLVIMNFTEPKSMGSVEGCSGGPDFSFYFFSNWGELFPIFGSSFWRANLAIFFGGIFCESLVIGEPRIENKSLVSRVGRGPNIDIHPPVPSGRFCIFSRWNRHIVILSSMLRSVG